MKACANETPGSAFNRHVRTPMVSGLLVLIPLAATLFILKLLFSSLTSFARPLVRPLVGDLPEYALALIAFFVTLLLIYLAGLITNHLVGLRLISMGEALLMKLPIVKSVYSASKHAVETFSSSTTKAFKAVTLVEFPRKGALSVGFITGTIIDPEGKTHYNVFVSTTPNPTAGFLIILPKDEVYLTDISVEDGVKMIISIGFLSPQSYRIMPPSRPFGKDLSQPK